MVLSSDLKPCRKIDELPICTAADEEHGPDMRDVMIGDSSIITPVADVEVVNLVVEDRKAFESSSSDDQNN